MKLRGNSWLIILLSAALVICGGIVWLFVLPARLRLPMSPEELFRHHVLQEIGDSVTGIKVVRTGANATNEGYTFRFKINRADLSSITDSRPFKRVEQMECRDGILSLDCAETPGLTTFLHPPGVYKPRWLTLETWKNPEAYYLREEGEYHWNTWLLVYNEQLGEAHFLVRLWKEGFPLF